MKKVVAFMIIICLSLSIFSAYADDSGEQTEKLISFNDISEGDTFYTAVMYLAKRDIINGKGNSLFCPKDTLKREELAKIFTKAFDLSMKDNAPVFNDVAAGTWYADCVRTVAQGEFMLGFSADKFGVGHNISRQDLAVVLRRFLEKNNINFSTEEQIVYADDADIADYAKESVSLLSVAGIMSEKADNCFAPKEDATRAETALAIYNALQFRQEQIDALGRYGPDSQYYGPFDLPDDRLQQAMPEPFDAAAMYGYEIAYEDFEDDDYGVLTSSGFTGTGVTVATEGGYDGGGCLIVEGNDDANAYPGLTIKLEDASPGDYYSMSVMLKGENYTGGDFYNAILSVYDDAGNWVIEGYDTRERKSNDWKLHQVIVQIPEVAQSYTDSEFYTLRLGGLVVKGTGVTAYYDNFSLKKLRFNPMNTVLMTPNYKGVIKGENGIGDISLRVYVDHLNNMWDLSTFKFVAQITDEEHNVLMKSEIDNVTSVMDVYFSSKDLEMGKDYYLESILTYKDSGELVQKDEWPLHKRPYDFKQAIGYDEYGRVTKNGEPWIPKGIYVWSGLDLVPDLLDEESIDFLQENEFNTTFNFGSSEFVRNLNDSIAESGKYRTIGINRSIYSQGYGTKWFSDRSTSQADLRGVIGRVAKNFNDLPNLIGYYQFDEQNPLKYSDELAWNRKIVEQYDLGHPTFCAIDKLYSNRPGIYADTSDFLGLDPYPVTGKQTSLALVSDYVTTAKKTHPNRPIYAILQGTVSRSTDLRSPTTEEFRNMTFQALIAGSCMLDCFSYTGMIKATTPGMTPEEMLDVVTDVYEEVDYLEPILLSVEPEPYYETTEGSDWLKTMTKRYDGKSYLFGVNTDISEKTARVYLDGVTKIKSMYTDTVYEADKTGWFTIPFEGFGTDVFEYEQEAYKSSHAELTHFGIVDAITINSESDNSEFVLNGDVSQITYNAKISDFAKLYINGNQVEILGAIDISGLNELEVKVVSEDERVTTVRNYKINRTNN